MVRMVDDLFELSRIHAGVLPLDPADRLARRPGQRGDRRRRPGGPGPAGAARRLGRGRRAGPRRPRRPVPGGRQPGDERDPAHPRRRRRSRSPAGPWPEGVELSVTDGCGGIPADDLDRVFDVAWRGSHARTPERAAAGAGLGLAIVKGIVEAHDGSVSGRQRGLRAAGSWSGSPPDPALAHAAHPACPGASRRVCGLVEHLFGLASAARTNVHTVDDSRGRYPQVATSGSQTVGGPL